MRDKRWDYLYDRQVQPVKKYILERFTEELVKELRVWPPPFVDWVTEELQRRYAIGVAERPREDVFRFALELCKLEMLRDEEGVSKKLGSEAAQRWQTPSEAAAGHLLMRLLAEKLYSLKEYCEGVRLTRDDLAQACDDIAQQLWPSLIVRS